MRQKLIVGNWKMHGSLAINAALLQAVKAGMADVSSAVGVCAPFPYLSQCREILDGSVVGWGAQDASAELQGAFTGEVSASMIAEFGCRYVIVGHSERRTLHRESDELVARKTLRALEAGLTPIVCVGETLEERESGATEAVVGRQLDVVLAAMPAGQVGRIVVAYEPVWAIGTGKTASSEQAQAVHAFLRSRLATVDAAAAASVQILYGGSVKPGNAAELFVMADIDGGLIGGASLKSDEFLAICRA